MKRKKTKKKSFFREIICLDYYDGVMLGVGISSSMECYYFEAVWESRKDCKRVYVLYIIDCTVYNEIEKICLKYYKTRTPYWFLPSTEKWKELDKDLNNVIKKIKKHKNTIKCVLLSSNFPSEYERHVPIVAKHIKKLKNLIEQDFYANNQLWLNFFYDND